MCCLKLTEEGLLYRMRKVACSSVGGMCLAGAIHQLVQGYPGRTQTCLCSVLSSFVACAAQGLFVDTTLLDVSEVDLADLKFLEGDPVIVVQFHCQQINCTRDKFGNVVEGAPSRPHGPDAHCRFGNVVEDVALSLPKRLQHVRYSAALLFTSCIFAALSG